MRRLVCLLIALPLTASALNLQVRRKFFVKEVSGTVMAWPPLANRWSRLRTGDPIWEDTLIQVSRDSSITFTLSASDGFQGLKAETMEITLNTPILMRLRENIPRRVTLNDYFIPKLPDAKPGGETEERLMFEDIREAWDRFAAHLLPQDIKAKFLGGAQEEKPQDSSVAVRAKKIRLYTPTQGAMNITNSLPEEIRVTWRGVSEAQAEYGVRIWEPDQARPDKPLGITNQDYYAATITKEGTYLVQVTTEDGRWQSEVRQFSVFLPMAGRGLPPSRTRVNLPLPLELPPKNFAFMVKAWPVSVTFTWERPNGGNGRQVYQFVLSDDKGKELYRRDTSDTNFSLKFSNPGVYRWFVASRPATQAADVPAGQIFSEIRTISMQNAPKAGTDPLAELIATRADKVFYLEAGF